MAVITGSSSSSGTNNPTEYTTGFTSRPVITLADTEQALSLPTGTKSFMLKNVGTVAIRYAYSAGGTTSSYITLAPNSYKLMTDLDGSARLIYVRSSKPLHQLELEYWT